MIDMELRAELYHEEMATVMDCHWILIVVIFPPRFSFKKPTMPLEAQTLHLGD